MSRVMNRVMSDDRDDGDEQGAPVDGDEQGDINYGIAATRLD